MIADLERDLYEYLKIEASIDKKLRESYVLPVERSFEEYCKNHFYDTTLAAFPSEKAPTEPSKPRREDFQGKDFRTSPGLIFLTIIAGIIFLPCVFIIPLMANRKQKKKIYTITPLKDTKLKRESTMNIAKSNRSITKNTRCGIKKRVTIRHVLR